MKLLYPVMLVLLIGAATVLGLSSSMDCPPSSQVTSCSPKCLQDTECAAMGGRCCPNLCNYRSCVIPKNNSKDQNKYNQGSGGAGSYCGNVKCNPFEKCAMDKSTSRMKCVRA